MIEIIGKSGSGKSFLANKLYESGYDRSIGYTTREMRPNEINGVDYFFISKTEFEKMINLNMFIDYKIRNGNYYGIRRDNLHENTIIVSSNFKKIEETTGTIVKKIYVDCDLITRYFRILKRNDSKNNMFNRIHAENFSFLCDYDALFVDNNNDDLTALNKIIRSDFSNQSMIANRIFVEQKVEEYISEHSKNIDNKLLLLLKYEEYLLRKYYLENRDLFSTETEKNYYSLLADYMDYINLKSEFSEDGLKTFIEDDTYSFEYKIKRK